MRRFFRGGNTYEVLAARKRAKTRGRAPAIHTAAPEKHTTHLRELPLLLAIVRPALVEPINVSHDLRRPHHLGQWGIAAASQEQLKQAVRWTRVGGRR